MVCVAIRFRPCGARLLDGSRVPRYCRGHEAVTFRGRLMRLFTKPFEAAMAARGYTVDHGLITLFEANQVNARARGLRRTDGERCGLPRAGDIR